MLLPKLTKKAYSEMAAKVLSDVAIPEIFLQQRVLKLTKASN